MKLLIETAYFLSIISFLVGLKLLSKPKKAKLGNLLAAMGMVLALIITIYSTINKELPVINFLIIIGAILAGTFLGKYMSKKIEMTEMPQLVSLFNATGGACAFLLGIVESNQSILFKRWEILVLLLGVLTGAIATSGSIVAYGKLAGKIKDRRTHIINYTSRILLLTFVGFTIAGVFNLIDISLLQYTIIIVATALLYGVLFVLPIGGADMPVVISLLNAVTGIATAFSGILYQNKVMIAGGIIVGAAGILLTVLMCRAMNRSLLKVLTGSFNKLKTDGGQEKEQEIIEISVSETALQLSLSNKIAIIPGYGLAVAQAQYLCKQLEKLLVDQNTDVHYIIHPVAGRMPGHMNVLLAEASVEYDLLKEMDDVNDEMSDYDMILIIGANDVVNPAAENNTNSPIYGMPIIKAYNCKSTVVLKRSMNKGYAGVQNELFEVDGCKLLFGDAKDTLQQIINQLKLV
jgi:NAD(P) transhydrogenase subunit beta